MDGDWRLEIGDVHVMMLQRNNNSCFLFVVFKFKSSEGVIFLSPLFYSIPNVPSALFRHS